jgi:hypothetical protein
MNDKLKGASPRRPNRDSEACALIMRKTEENDLALDFLMPRYLHSVTTFPTTLTTFVSAPATTLATLVTTPATPSSMLNKRRAGRIVECARGVRLSL